LESVEREWRMRMGGIGEYGGEEWRVWRERAENEDWKVKTRKSGESLLPDDPPHPLVSGGTD